MGFNWEDVSCTVNRSSSLQTGNLNDGEGDQTHNDCWSKNQTEIDANNNSNRISSSSNIHAQFRSDCHWWCWSILCPSQLGASAFFNSRILSVFY